jgi:hypothetical protein
MKKKRLKLYIHLVLLILILGYGTYWVNDYYRPTEDAVPVFNSGKSMEISKDDFITIYPKEETITTGFIFYPGGKVAPEAYIPIASKIASKGYTVVIVPMPLKLAVLGGNKGEEVIKAHPEIKNWVIGGHSLGGVMAANFAKKHLDQIKGLVMFAAYPQDKDNLSSSNLKVVSIYGTEDGCADIAKVTGAKGLLPMDASFKPIEGGNHAQFGNYGQQKGDNKAALTSSEQQAAAVQYTVSLLEAVSK